MIVAKITPPAKRVIQDSPFTTKEFSGDIMVVKCKYLIGVTGTGQNDKVEFDVKFGNIKYESNPDGSQGNSIFEEIYSTRVMIDGASLSNWGTDDTIVYNIVAQKLGIQVVSTLQVDVPIQ